MFEKKKNTNMWIILGTLLILVLISIILQAQILVMVSNLQASVFSDFFSSNPLPPMKEAIMDSNPLPPMKEIFMDSNPLPPMKEAVMDSNPLPPMYIR